MIYLIAEIAIGTTYWAVKSTYNACHYMIYGSQETTEQKLIKQIEDLREELRKEKEEEQMALQAIKIRLYSNYYNERDKN